MFGLEFGEDLRTRAYVDAQATIRLSHRAGLGKALHIDMDELWIQDALERLELELVKGGAERNPADVLVKPVFHEITKRHLETIGSQVVPSDFHTNSAESRGGGRGGRHAVVHDHSTAGAPRFFIASTHAEVGKRGGEHGSNPRRCCGSNVPRRIYRSQRQCQCQCLREQAT